MGPEGTSRNSQPGVTCPCTQEGNHTVQDNNKAVDMDYRIPSRCPQLDNEAEGADYDQRAKRQSDRSARFQEDRTTEQTKTTQSTYDSTLSCST